MVALAPAPSDPELVRRFVQHGDERAFAEIVMRHRAWLYVVALNVTRSALDAEETMWSTFMRAYRKLATFRGECALKSWLHGICLRLAINRREYNRRRRRDVTVSLDYENDDGLTIPVPDPNPSPSDHAEMAEIDQSARAIAHTLTPRLRSAIELRFAGRSYEEIASDTGCGVGTVKSRIHRARIAMHQRGAARL